MSVPISESRAHLDPTYTQGAGHSSDPDEQNPNIGA
jgi:hypothetical protein